MVIAQTSSHKHHPARVIPQRSFRGTIHGLSRVLEADAQDELAAGAPQPPLVPPSTDDIADLHD